MENMLRPLLAKDLMYEPMSACATSTRNGSRRSTKLEAKYSISPRDSVP